jgi:hypothetical protein
MAATGLGLQGHTIRGVEQRAVPVLRIAGGSGSLEFIGRLGFEIQWEHRFGEGFPLQGIDVVGLVVDPDGNRLRVGSTASAG